MLAIFFVGIGASAILTGFARNPFELAVGLTLIGLFASIYHPVGIAMLVEGREKVGKLLGVNGVAGNLGLAAAAIVAASLSEAVSWRAAFIVPGAVTLAHRRLVHRGLPGVAQPRGGIDAALARRKLGQGRRAPCSGWCW